MTKKHFKVKAQCQFARRTQKKTASSYALYGNADYIGLKISSSTNYEDTFNFILYSDSSYKKKVATFSATYKKGTTYETLTLSLKGLKSGTYYAKTFVTKYLYQYGQVYNYQHDTSTLKKYKITIKRGGTSIKKTNTVMYGYDNTVKGPQIYWFAVPNAKGYYVYKYVNKQYKKIATVKATKDAYCSFVDKTVTKNSTSTYRVTAYNADGSGYRSLNKCSAKYITAPKVTVSCTTNSLMKISWTTPAKGLTYYVYRYNEASSTWKKIATTTDTLYYDSKLTSGNYYYYTVIGEDSTTTTAYNENGVGALFLSAPDVHIAKGDGTTDLSWKEVAGASSYRVYRKEFREKSWTYLATTDDCTYKDSSMEKGPLYVYTVKSMNGKTNGSYNAKGVFFAYIDAPVLDELTYDENGTPVLSWNSVGKEVSYSILKKNNDDWSIVAQTEQTSSTLTTLTSTVITDFTVSVRAYSAHTRLQSEEFDTVGKTFTYYPKIEKLTSTVENDGIHLSWNTVNADSYNIYRKAEIGDYQLIATTSNPNYCDTTALPNTNYTYEITYTHNSVEKADKGAEISVKYIDKTVTFDIDNYTASGSSYNIKVNDFKDGDTVSLYKKVDGVWILYKKATTSTFTCSGTNRAEYAVAVTDTDGNVTVLPNDGFTITFFPQKAQNIKYTVDRVNKQIVVSLDAIEFAESYSLYRATSSTAEKELVGNALTPNFIDSNITPNSTYYYYITATDGKYTSDYIYISSRTVYPEMTLTSSNSEYGITLKWTLDKNIDSTSVEVYKKVAGTEKWETIKLNGTTSYCDNFVKSGVTYVYDIAYESGYKTKTHLEKTSTIYLSPPLISKTQVTSSSIKITWGKVTGATSYKIYKKVYENSKWGNWKCLTDTTKTSYVDTAVKSGVNNRYIVAAVNGKSKSAYSPTAVALFLSIPKLKSATSTTSGIKLTYGSVTGAKGYYIYRKTGNGGWAKIATVKSNVTSYTDKNAKKGTTYYYTVRAYNGHAASYYNTKGIACKKK